MSNTQNISGSLSENQEESGMKVFRLCSLPSNCLSIPDIEVFSIGSDCGCMVKTSLSVTVTLSANGIFADGHVEVTRLQLPESVLT